MTSLIRETIKNGVAGLSEIYKVCGAKTDVEKHNVRGAISSLHKRGEIVNASRGVWVYA